MLKRTIQCLALGGSAVALGLVACGSPASGNPTPTTGATVSLDLMGASGTKVASCAGTLISPDTVITSAHCVHGVSFWQVTLPSTGQAVHSSIGYTFDWSDLSSAMSHPLHHDVAVIKLDTAISLAAYPSLATSTLTDGAATMRVRPGADSDYEAVATRAYDGTAVGFPDYYYSTIDASETLVTGSALIDPTTNTIYGIVSSRGATTGLLYSSRVEMVSEWMRDFDSCSGPATIEKIYLDCHPTPPPPCDGGSEGSSSGSSSGASSGGTSSGTTGGASSGGTSSGTTGGGASSGGTSSGSTGASSGSTGGASSGTTGGGNGTTGSGGGDGGTCGGGGGYCEGNGCGTTVGSGGNGTNGGGGGSGGTSSGTGGTSSGTTGGGGNGTTGGGGNGGNGASSGGGYNGASSGASGSGNGTTGSGGGGDNGCTDSTCGGCTDDPNCTDNVVDYGGSTTPPPVTSNPH